MLPNCDRCGNKEVVIQASAFCVECEDVWLCVHCFTWHLIECINEIPEPTDYAPRLVWSILGPGIKKDQSI